MLSIVCSIAVTPELYNYTGGIFEDLTGSTHDDHEVNVVGWGVENGTKYWIARNPWGTYWGEKGLFRIVRGTNNLGIECNCSYGSTNIHLQINFSYAVPRDTWTNDERNTTRPAEHLRKDNIYPWWKELFAPVQTCVLDQAYVAPLIRNILPHVLINGAELPQNYDWRNVIKSFHHHSIR